MPYIVEGYFKKIGGDAYGEAEKPERFHCMAVITMVITVLAAPDILTMFSFGKLFPTYLLTFVYNSSNAFAELIIPCITLILLQFGLC